MNTTASSSPATFDRTAPSSNADRVRGIYAAFGRGDVPSILAELAEDVDWEYGIAANPVPWLQPRQGRAAVGGFFEALGALEFHTFAPHTILSGPGVVVALVDIEATVRATGARIREVNEAHIFHFDERGRVVRFRHGVDTARHIAAVRGAATPA
jgi:uncharacterized protein